VSTRLLFDTRREQTTTRQGVPRTTVIVVVGVVGILLLATLAIPFMIGSDMFFAANAGCSGEQTGTVGQPPAGAKAKNSIPADYLNWYQVVGRQYDVPWTLLAGIGTVESDNGQSMLPGVHTGQNGFGAAGPMQIGIGGQAGNVWGGLPVHPGNEVVDGVATDEDGGQYANIYDAADAIAGAAKYLTEAGVQNDPSAAIFAYNHLQSYVQSVLYYAGLYAGGNYTVVAATIPVTDCQTSGGSQAIGAPNQAMTSVIDYAEQQIGKPYLWGGTGPDAFDCSGLVMMAYRAAGVYIPRTSQEQFAWGPRVPASRVEPGDLVFFAGADGTPGAPGHVGLVIGHDKMVEAYATGFPIRISAFGTSAAAPGDEDPVGFTRPWAHSGAVLAVG
jgi:cell wall-associated NlpC family hydrolase